MQLSKSFLVLLAALQSHAASPVDFGRREFLAALEARGLSPDRFRIVTEHSMVLPSDGFAIQGYLIRGGNLRGIMFGLIEAAAQIRKFGMLRPVKAIPAIPVRGIRWTQPLPADPAALFATLARARFNRFVVAYPDAAFDELRKAADAAVAHGIDFGVALLPAAAPGEFLAAIPQLKFIEAVPTEANLGEITAAGRLLTLDLNAETLTEPLLEAALSSLIPLQVIAASGSTGFFLRQPAVADRDRPWQVIWRVQPTSNSDAATIRAALPGFTVSQTQGFELEVPPSPGADFYELWGRLAYNPEEPSAPPRPASQAKPAIKKK
jgi:hypothetical protein